MGEQQPHPVRKPVSQLGPLASARLRWAQGRGPASQPRGAGLPAPSCPALREGPHRLAQTRSRVRPTWDGQEAQRTLLPLSRPPIAPVWPPAPYRGPPLPEANEASGQSCPATCAA